MKILQIMAGAYHGGAETAFVDTCLAMKQYGCDQVIVTRAFAPRIKILRDAGLKVYGLPFRGRLDVLTPYLVKQILKKEKPDIIQSWMARGASVVPKHHGAFAHVARLGGYYKLKNFTSADFFVTITPDLKEWLVTQGIEKSRIQVITNFAEDPVVSKKVHRTEFGTPDDAIICLALSRYHTNKALDVLIRAAKKFEKIHLWLAGEGPERGALQALASECGISNRVHFLGWRNDRDALLEACDICVFPSRQEPFGTVFVQAWAAQRPVISSLSEGPRQFMRDGEDGLLFPIDDVGALESCLQRLTTDHDLKQKLVMNGYNRFVNEFTKDKTVKSYTDLYRTLMAQ